MTRHKSVGVRHESVGECLVKGNYEAVDLWHNTWLRETLEWGHMGNFRCECGRSFRVVYTQGCIIDNETNQIVVGF